MYAYLDSSHSIFSCFLCLFRFFTHNQFFIQSDLSSLHDSLWMIDWPTIETNKNEIHTQIVYAKYTNLVNNHSID